MTRLTNQNRYSIESCNKYIYVEVWKCLRHNYLERNTNCWLQSQMHRQYIHTHVWSDDKGQTVFCPYQLLPAHWPSSRQTWPPHTHTHTHTHTRKHPPCRIHYCWHSTFNYAAVSRSPSPQIHFNKLSLWLRFFLTTLSLSHLLSLSLSLSQG